MGMGIHTPQMQRIPDFYNVSIASGSNTDWFSDPFQNPGGNFALLLRVLRVAETGTSTLNLFIQGQFRGPAGGGLGTATAATGDGWYDLPYSQMNDWADGELGIRQFVYSPHGMVPDTEVAGDLRFASDADTYHRVAFGFLPETVRLRARNGGTTVTNQFHVEGLWIPCQ